MKGVPSRRQKEGRILTVAIFRSVFIVLAITFFLSLPVARAAKEGGQKGRQETSVRPEISVRPRVLHPGQAGLVTIVFPSGHIPARVGLRFKQRAIPLKEEGTGRFLGLFPLSLKEPVGDKVLELSWTEGPEAEGPPNICRIGIRVEPKRYRQEHLKVSKKMVEFSKETLDRVLADQRAVKKAASGLKPVMWELPFIWPVDSRITSPFGLRRFFNNRPRSPHSGVDLKASEGQPVLSANYGVITLARQCYLSGNTLVVDHGGGVATIYAHLSRMDVREGQRVDKGQVIGLAGSTGRVTGPHLHWGVSILGVRVDPEAFMSVAGSRLTGSKLNAAAPRSEK